MQLVNVVSEWYINSGLTKCFLKLICRRYLKTRCVKLKYKQEELVYMENYGEPFLMLNVYNFIISSVTRWKCTITIANEFTRAGV